MTNANTRVAVIGCGHWGKNLVRNFAKLGALDAICDADEDRLRAQTSLYPGVHTVSQFADVLSDQNIRAVVLASPAALHNTHVKQALLKGKDVFVEKPLALTYEQGEELVDLARARDAILMVGHVLEYHPAVARLKEIVASGDLGQPWYVYSNRLNLGKVRQEENILWSFAPHDISVISSLLGSEPLEVSASGSSYLQPSIVDVTITNLVFPEGARAHIFVSYLELMRKVADNVVFLFEGKVIYFGSVSELEKSPHPHIQEFLAGDRVELEV